MAQQDDVDFVPSSRSVVFGHHFTSIAGTGPIVGPAIAVLWGWVPALLWVFLGSIFIGAVHDFGSLVISLRSRGDSIGDVAGRILNRRVRVLFLLILTIGLTIVLAIFGLVISSVFKQFPQAIFPCVIQIPLAIALGRYIRKQGASLLIPSIIALAIMYLSVIFGNDGWLGTFNQTLASWPTMTWVIVLLGYCFIASVLPVWTLLQPRDFINSIQLLSALALIIVGLVAAALLGGPSVGPDHVRPPLELVAPAFDPNPTGAPMIFPFLFITIACGAISGFHCLVASGTSSKQLRKETDAPLIGFGSMLTEGFLATLVILACTAGIGLGVTAADGSTLFGSAAWDARYTSWDSMGLKETVGAFVEGASNFLGAIGIPATVGLALMGVFVASFAATTLDTATRLQRYVIHELGRTMTGAQAKTKKRMPTPLSPQYWFANRYIATGIAVVVAASLAAVPLGDTWSWAQLGTGGLLLWPMFGATNQMLAGLAFLVIAFYLWRRKKPIWFLVLPLLLMIVLPTWAMIQQAYIGYDGSDSWYEAERWLLVAIATITIVLQIWMVIEGLLLFPRARGVLEPQSQQILHNQASPDDTKRMRLQLKLVYSN